LSRKKKSTFAIASLDEFLYCYGYLWRNKCGDDDDDDYGGIGVRRGPRNDASTELGAPGPAVAPGIGLLPDSRGGPAIVRLPLRMRGTAAATGPVSCRHGPLLARLAFNPGRECIRREPLNDGSTWLVRRG